MPQEGAVAINKATGERAKFTGGQWVKEKFAPAEASMRSRLDMGMAPMIQGNQTMMQMEKAENPLNRDWGATMLDVDIPIPFTSTAGGGSAMWSPGSALAKKVGGQDYQDYTTAASTFESQLMPIMSGAAVSPSEAQRQIRAALPAFGDSKETLATKARTRQMMLNGASKAKGVTLPYPDLDTYGVNNDTLPASQGKAAPPQSGGIPTLSPDQARSAPKGTRFRTTDGRVMVR